MCCIKIYDSGVLELKGGANTIRCHNCGASIDTTSSACSYCHSEIKYLQAWILDLKNKDE